MIRKSFVVFIASFFIFLPRVHSTSAGTTIFPILKLNPAARTAGMGGVNGAITSQSLLNNPAVLPWIKDKEISAQHLSYISEMSYSLLTYVHPLDEDKSLSASFGYFGVRGLTRTQYDSTNIDGYSEHGSFGFSDILVNLGYGKKTSYDFSYGAGLKFVRESIDKNSNFGAMLSLGGFYKPSYERWQIAFGLFNLGPQVKGFNLPVCGYLSIGTRIQPELFWIGEIVGYIDQVVELRTGFEYNISDILSFRVGYKYPLEDSELGKFPDVNLTGGVGFSFSRFSLDYAWVPYGDFGQTHRITLGMKIYGIKDTVEDSYEPIKLADLERIEKTRKKQTKVNIAVANFAGNNVSAADASIVSGFLRTELVNTGSFNIMDRSNMNAILSEQEFQFSGCTDQKCAVKIGKILNVEQMVVGSISKLFDTYYITANLVDVETGIILKSFEQDAKNADQLREACWIISQKLSSPH